MGEPVDGASSVPASAMDPPTRALDSPVDLPVACTLGMQNAKVTKKMYKEHVSSEEEEEKQQEEEEEEEEDDDDQGGRAKERTTWRAFDDDDLFKYRGCSWPEVVGLKVHKAKRIIRKGKPDIYFEVVSRDQMLTMCYWSRRVRLMVDRSNCVVETPHVG